MTILYNRDIIEVMGYLLAFICGLLIDLFYTLWVRLLANGRPYGAAAASSAIGMAGAIGITAVAADHWKLPAYVAGLYLGTLAGYWLSKR